MMPVLSRIHDKITALFKLQGPTHINGSWRGKVTTTALVTPPGTSGGGLAAVANSGIPVVGGSRRGVGGGSGVVVELARIGSILPIIWLIIGRFTEN